MRYLDVFLLDLNTKVTIVASHSINFINQNPMFSLDGKKIVFESVKFNNAEIYSLDIVSNLLINLTEHPKWDCAPAY